MDLIPAISSFVLVFTVGKPVARITEFGFPCLSTQSISFYFRPVTGGFTKGKGSRFQLFGDTMTTAMLIQQTGMSNRIHLSEATADALDKAGKHGWVKKRENKLTTAAKGEIQTYWLEHRKLEGLDLISTRMNNSDKQLLKFAADDSKERWIQWNVETFKGVGTS